MCSHFDASDTRRGYGDSRDLVVKGGMEQRKTKDESRNERLTCEGSILKKGSHASCGMGFTPIRS